MKVIFMGTPDFAVPALKKLIESEHKVVCAYTQPPRPADRGHKLKSSPVQQLAEENNIEVRYPTNLRDESEIKKFQNLEADIAVVAAYGLILPIGILTDCKYGCINIHPSILPRWRGAAPIQRAIMAGDRETGVGIMQMNEGLDTGDILLEKRIKLNDVYDAKMLHDELADLGADMILQTIERLKNNTITPRIQADEGLTYAKKITKEESVINWNKSAREINNLIRGLSPYPAAYFMYKNEKIKILQAEISDSKFDFPAGKIIDNHLTIACGEGNLSPTIVQRSGKKPMATSEMLKGFAIPNGTQL